AFTAACRDELAALKPGNVHVFADGHRMTAAQFIRSAEAAAAPIAAEGASVGSRILRAVAATRGAVRTNTNLGIILLCPPLAAPADLSHPARRGRLAEVLDALTGGVAGLASGAFVLAPPGGLGGAARHDARAPATVSLKQAMAAAADRDRIARQYVSSFADVFDTGADALAAARARRDDASQVTLAVYLAFLARFPDNRIVRKPGSSVGEEVRERAAQFERRLEEDAAHLHADLMAWDETLKRSGINPGTSADLTVATLFVARVSK